MSGLFVSFLETPKRLSGCSRFGAEGTSTAQRDSGVEGDSATLTQGGAVELPTILDGGSGIGTKEMKPSNIVSNYFDI